MSPSRKLLQPAQIVVGLGILAILGWSYGATFTMLVDRWWNEQDYTYAFGVMPFALFVLWARREWMPEQPWQGSLWGLLFLAICALMRFASAFFQMHLIEPLSLVPCMAGIILLAAGWDGLRWSWPAIIFLAFMVPLPGRVAVWLSEPLRQIGAGASTYLLQTFGIPAVARGNIIALSRWELGVEEACSGLRMLMLFMTVCVGAAMVLQQRDPWERVIVVLSAAPIAVIANVIRITVTGIMYEVTGPEWAEQVFHWLAGLFMMPLAVLLLWSELLLLSLLFHAPDDEAEWL